jgi:hypothetical protein
MGNGLKVASFFKQWRKLSNADNFFFLNNLPITVWHSFKLYIHLTGLWNLTRPKNKFQNPAARIRNIQYSNAVYYKAVKYPVQNTTLSTVDGVQQTGVYYTFLNRPYRQTDIYQL